MAAAVFGRAEESEILEVDRKGLLRRLLEATTSTSEEWYDRASSEARVSGAKDCLGKGFSKSGPFGGEGFFDCGASEKSDCCLRFLSIDDILRREENSSDQETKVLFILIKKKNPKSTAPVFWNEVYPQDNWGTEGSSSLLRMI